MEMSIVNMEMLFLFPNLLSLLKYQQLLIAMASEKYVILNIKSLPLTRLWKPIFYWTGNKNSMPAFPIAATSFGSSCAVKIDCF